MSISVNPVAVADAISSLSISGVTLKSINEIPDSGQMVCPIIFPQPTGFISGIVSDNMSFGSMGTQKQNFTYSLNYVFLFTELGSGVNAFAPYEDLITKLTLTINTILNNDVVNGLVDLRLESIQGIGEVQDPAGYSYWGALFTLKCLEYGQ